MYESSARKGHEPRDWLKVAVHLLLPLDPSKVAVQLIPSPDESVSKSSDRWAILLDLNEV